MNIKKLILLIVGIKLLLGSLCVSIAWINRLWGRARPRGEVPIKPEHRGKLVEKGGTPFSLEKI